VDPFLLNLDPDPAPGFLVNTDPGSRLLMTKNFAKFSTAFFLGLYEGFPSYSHRKRTHPALQNIKVLVLFLARVISCMDPEFRIHRLYWIRSQSGTKSEKLLETANPIVSPAFGSIFQA
jgi:hypothetical protein